MAKMKIMFWSSVVFFFATLFFLLSTISTAHASVVLDAANYAVTPAAATGIATTTINGTPDSHYLSVCGVRTFGETASVDIGGIPMTAIATSSDFVSMQWFGAYNVATSSSLFTMTTPLAGMRYFGCANFRGASSTPTANYFHESTTTGNSLVASHVTQYDNSIVIGYAGRGTGGVTLSAGTSTSLVASFSLGLGMYRIDGNLSPAGSYNLTVNAATTSTFMDTITLEVASFVDTSGTSTEQLNYNRLIRFETFQAVSFALAASLFLYMLVGSMRILFKSVRPTRR